MRYVSGSVQILKLIGVEGSFGLSCRAHCPNCGSLHALRSKFYQGDGVDELRPALRDLYAVVRCASCSTKSDFVQGTLQDDLSSAKVVVISRERAHKQALNPVVLVLQRPKTAARAYWQLEEDSLEIRLHVGLVHMVAVPTLELNFAQKCRVCGSLLNANAAVHLGFAGKTELPPTGSWPLTARWYVHFRHIGEALMARIAKDYLCAGCKVSAGLSEQAAACIKQWLDANLTLDWLNASMEALPKLQESAYNDFLKRSSGLSNDLQQVFSRQILLAPHALRDWQYQLEEFERNATVLTGVPRP